ncbi:MAG: type IV toxin-antitoxin system AbiEi family antitoxin domain-containing protein [Acidobacteria bacterium]|nr:type IV toxin-antitoxin system AbiEi family antitoxin domain-containing protein [Acidobacteriota bacterium]
MANDGNNERLFRLMSKSGVVRASDLRESGIPRVYLTRAAAAGRIERTARGLYRLATGQPSEQESLMIVASKVPKAVFCLLTALQFHELTTQLPRAVWIAMPRGSHTPRMLYPPLRMVQYSGQAYSSGIETHVCDRVELRVYSVAKTVADCFKHRNKIGLDVAIEALRDARFHKKATADEIWQFAKICRVTNVMRPYLEVL